MLNNGLKIKIKGTPFKKDSFIELNILKSNSKNIKQSTIIYGTNGSGKTSIANAMNELKLEPSKRHFTTECVDFNDHAVQIDYLNQLYVFNESFIDNKVKFTTTDGLDTIVLLGDEVANENKIIKIEEAIKINRDKLKDIDLSVYEDITNHENPLFVMNKIISKLKSDGNWASMMQKIKCSKRKPHVDEFVVKTIVDNHSEKISIDEYNDLLNNYLKINKNNQKYKFFLNTPIQSFNEDMFNKLMNKKLRIISVDEMAKRILKTIEDYSELRTNEIIETFNSNINYCPYCFRPIDNNEKKNVIKLIKSALSKESDKFVKLLDNQKIDLYNPVELPEFIDGKVKAEYIFICTEYNKMGNLINELIEKKKVNLYTSIGSYDISNFIVFYNMLESVIAKINYEIANYNNLIDQHKKIKKRLVDYSNYISWETIKELYQEYEFKLQQKEMKEEEFNKLNNIKMLLENKLKELNAKKANIKDAGTEINKALSFIFLDNNRISLGLRDMHYIVSVNGQQVPLNKLSTGERNIIALCYFFCSIGEGKKTNERYNDDYLIFIDDPISSFDHDNKVGIYSFLRQKIRQFSNSSFVFLTHSYEVGYNLAKIFNDIYGVGKTKHLTNYIEIKNCQIVNTNLNLAQGKNQYNMLIKEIFKYAQETESKLNDFTVGNSIRRVLEMFASFEYNMSFERIIDQVDGKNKINEVLKNYMFRIMVNNESHSTISAYAADEVNRFEMFTREEKIKTAKLTLIMLDTLNPKHIKAYLDDDDLLIIDKWKEEIEDSINYENEIQV